MAATPPGGGPMSMADGAVGIHEFYLSLVKAGFSEAQALYLVGQMVASSVRGGPAGAGS